MTDHRVTDLSYGHLGEALYDVDEQSWYFSSETSLGKCVKSNLRMNIYNFYRVLHTAFATLTRVYTSFSASSSKLDQDSCKSPSIPRKMASKGPA
jgi:uncharacterized protein (DUF2336 family)